jgi:hypothetical protein
MKITRKCPITGIVNTLDIPVTYEQLQDWENKKGLIQNVMSNLTPDQREFIMTGILPTNWDDIFLEMK